MPLATKDLQREYQRLWMAKRRSSWIEAQGGKCVTCESTERLEVDHIDRSKKTMNPAAIWSRKQHIQDAELENCQVLCNICHKEKTIKERMEESNLQHGDYGMYKSRGCRCDLCKETNAARVRKQRAKLKAQAPSDGFSRDASNIAGSVRL